MMVVNLENLISHAKKFNEENQNVGFHKKAWIREEKMFAFYLYMTNNVIIHGKMRRNAGEFKSSNTKRLKYDIITTVGGTNSFSITDCTDNTDTREEPSLTIVNLQAKNIPNLDQCTFKPSNFHIHVVQNPLNATYQGSNAEIAKKTIKAGKDLISRNLKSASKNISRRLLQFVTTKNLSPGSKIGVSDSIFYSILSSTKIGHSIFQSIRDSRENNPFYALSRYTEHDKIKKEQLQKLFKILDQTYETGRYANQKASFEFIKSEADPHCRELLSNLPQELVLNPPSNLLIFYILSKLDWDFQKTIGENFSQIDDLRKCSKELHVINVTVDTESKPSQAPTLDSPKPIFSNTESPAESPAASPGSPPPFSFPQTQESNSPKSTAPPSRPYSTPKSVRDCFTQEFYVVEIMSKS